jgi:hypothetical protein
MSKQLNGFLDSREFYELSQAYRHAPVDKPDQVVQAWENLKTAILDAAVPETDEVFRARLLMHPMVGVDRPAIIMGSGAVLDAIAVRFGLRRIGV